ARSPTQPWSPGPAPNGGLTCPIVRSAVLETDPAIGTKSNAAAAAPFMYHRPCAPARSTETTRCDQASAVTFGPGTICGGPPVPISRKLWSPLRYSAQPRVLYSEVDSSARFSTIVRGPALFEATSIQAAIANGP